MTDQDVLVAASEQELVRQAGLGDRAAMTGLVELHSAAILRYATTMLDGDRELAQDVVQEAWIKAWVHLPAFRGESAFRTWLFRITMREVSSSRRRRRPLLIEHDRLSAQLEVRRETSADDAADDAGQLSDALAVELTGLPWRQRAVWLLREFEDLPYDQIAEVLGTNVTTVRGQLHRARRTLATRMVAWR